MACPDAHAGAACLAGAEDAARRVEARRGTASGWAEALRELGAVDQAVYEAVAGTPTPELDEPFRRLSNAANSSRLWLGIAAAIAVFGGRRGRRAAMEGLRDARHEAEEMRAYIERMHANG